MAKPRSPLDTYTPPDAPGLVARVVRCIKALIADADWPAYTAALRAGDLDEVRDFLLRQDVPTELAEIHALVLAEKDRIERTLLDTEHSGENLPVLLLRAEADVLSHASPHTADDAAAIARRLAECKREIQEATVALENRRVALLYERGLRQYFGELFGEVSKRLSGCAMLPPAVLN